jgi:hypothetical protein
MVERSKWKPKGENLKGWHEKLALFMNFYQMVGMVGGTANTIFVVYFPQEPSTVQQSSVIQLASVCFQFFWCFQNIYAHS